MVPVGPGIRVDVKMEWGSVQRFNVVVNDAVNLETANATLGGGL